MSEPAMTDLGLSAGPANNPRSRDLTERVMEVMVGLAALCVAAIFLWIAGDILRNGLPHLSWSFLLEPPLDAGRSGGIAPILVATLLLLAVCLAVSVPLGVGTAILLSEFSRRGGGLGTAIRGSLDVLAGVPSIVFGLFGNAFFSLFLGLGFSVLAGGLTLAFMVLPILVRSVEAGLRAVPDDYRWGTAALGLSRGAALRQLLLPAAAPSLVVGVVLGVGRALAETAALLYTSGYVDRMPASLLDSGRSMSVHIYDLAMNVPGGEGQAYATALVLLGLIGVINLLTSWISQQWLHSKITPQ